MHKNLVIIDLDLSVNPCCMKFLPYEDEDVLIMSMHGASYINKILKKLHKKFPEHKAYGAAENGAVLLDVCGTDMEWAETKYRETCHMQSVMEDARILLMDCGCRKEEYGQFSLYYTADTKEEADTALKTAKSVFQNQLLIEKSGTSEVCVFFHEIDKESAIQEFLKSHKYENIRRDYAEI